MTPEEALDYERLHMGQSDLVLVDSHQFPGALVIVYDQYPSDYAKRHGSPFITRRMAAYKDGQTFGMFSHILSSRSL